MYKMCVVCSSVAALYVSLRWMRVSGVVFKHGVLA